jgi:hypothetical protein
MAGTPIPFPVTAVPSRLHTEPQTDGRGDLLNLLAVKRGEEVVWTQVPGLERWTPVSADPSSRIPRGMRQVGNYLVTAWTDEVTAISPNGVETVLTGAVLAGDGPVTIAANLRTNPEIAIVTELGAFLADLNTMTLAAYPLTDVSAAQDGSEMVDNLGAVNSVDYYAGYLVFSRANGDIVASDLQSAIIPDLSEDKAQYAGDALLRILNNGDTVLACGTGTIEVWQDVGKSPFPLQRATVIPVGIAGKWSIAGGPGVWERGVLFVASDFTVRLLNGYQPEVVSNSAVEADLSGYRATPDAIRASVYIAEGQAIFSISTPTWTWEFNLSTGSWHRRESFGLQRWRGGFSQPFMSRWYVQDELAGGVLRIDPAVRSEAGARLRWMIESGAIKDFPVAVRIPVIDFDFRVGIGRLDRPDEEADPAVAFSWSHDGGASWSNPLVRSLGQQGRYGTKVSLRNIGRSTIHGTRLRVEGTDPVEIVFRGAVAPTLKPSRARPVGATA